MLLEGMAERPPKGMESARAVGRGRGTGRGGHDGGGRGEAEGRGEGWGAAVISEFGRCGYGPHHASRGTRGLRHLENLSKGKFEDPEELPRGN